MLEGLRCSSINSFIPTPRALDRSLPLRPFIGAFGIHRSWCELSVAFGINLGKRFGLRKIPSEKLDSSSSTKRSAKCGGPIIDIIERID